ncbi:ImpA family type VI secretion system protein [Pseudomonas knackmussii]|uniref:type VI secretion system protein TssA n=1 Tax=Pseudomonas knackmussii TaxID=65741 RepID=UPI000A00C3B0|nr:type VI secretion system ImpA family N-terminal domain-containing protein [Pseudomonas knackmussii]
MNYQKDLAMHYLNLLGTPISRDSYVGSSARYSPEYEQLERELSKGLALGDAGKFDWERVRQLSETVLSEQSKDLRVAAWLTWGLYQCESFPGLNAGIGLIRGLCEQHWQDVHPTKARTRAAALGWLTTRLEPLFTEDLALKDQLPLFRELADNLTGLEAILSRELGADAPLLLPQCRRLAEMLQRAAQGQPEPGSVGAVVAQVKQAASPTSTRASCCTSCPWTCQAARVRRFSGSPAATPSRRPPAARRWVSTATATYRCGRASSASCCSSPTTR